MADLAKADIDGLDLLPLHALLSAALVVFTLEADDEAELGHNARAEHDVSGEHGSRFSLVAWLNVMQYVAEGPTSVADICAQTHATTPELGFVLGCLERWGFVTVALKASVAPRTAKRDGWGTARRVTAQAVVGWTAKGETATRLWPEAIDTVEARWRTRHRSALTAATKAASALAATAELSMPQGLPSGWMKGDWRQFPQGTLDQPTAAQVPVAFGRALLAVTIAYERAGGFALALAANVLRLIDDGGTLVSEIKHRSGLSAQTAAVACTAVTKHLGWAEETTDSTGRRKLLRLTAAGEAAAAGHLAARDAADRDLGPAADKTRRAMQKLLGTSHDGQLALITALTPPAGVRRSGAAAPALGRDKVAAAATTRNREIVAQTTRFVEQPFRALPHYPVWDGNRGFGP